MPGGAADRDAHHAHGHITLVLGGTRSGKSAVAEQLAADTRAPVVYLATGPTGTDTLGRGDDDPAMTARIAAHRARRPASWTTVECGPHLVEALRTHPSGTVLVDSLGTWLAAHLDFEVDVAEFLEALSARTGTTVIVSEEVGMSVHAATPLGRAFVDAMGELNLAVAAIAHDVGLVVAGRTLWLPQPEAGPR